MSKKRPQLLAAGPLILHDNARPHIADVVTKELRDYGWEDFDLFPQLKELMRGRRFSSLEELSTDGTRVIRYGT